MIYFVICRIINTLISTSILFLRFVKDGGFSVILLVLPSKTGKVLAWLVAAPMDLDTLTVRAPLNGAEVDSPVIPTTAVKLALGKHQMECKGVFLPAEDGKDSATIHEWGHSLPVVAGIRNYLSGN